MSTDKITDKQVTLMRSLNTGERKVTGAELGMARRLHPFVELRENYASLSTAGRRKLREIDYAAIDEALQAASLLAIKHRHGTLTKVEARRFTGIHDEARAALRSLKTERAL